MIRAITALLFFSALTVVSLKAQPGIPDPTFNGDGFHVYSETEFASEIYDVVELADGSIIHTGYTRVQQGSLKIMVGKKLSNGTPDLSFGINGYAFADFGYEATGANINGEHIALLPDGKFIIAGQLVRGDPFADMIFIARFNSDGSEDLTFSENGIAEFELGGIATPRITNVSFKVDAQGRYLFSSTIYVTTNATNLNIARFTADGERDLQFGTNGMVTRPITGANGRSYDFIILADGSILTQTGSSPDNVSYNTVLYKTGADGQSVPNDVFTFSTPNGTNSLSGIALASNGKIALSGGARPADSTFFVGMVMQLNSDLTTDEAFGIGGTKYFRINGENDVEMNHVTYSADDSRIIIAGGCRYEYGGGGGKGGGNNGKDWIIASLLSTNGNFDPAFGTGGFTHKDFGFGSDLVKEILLLQNGKIVLVGTVSQQNNSVGAVGRFNPAIILSIEKPKTPSTFKLITTVSQGNIMIESEISKKTDLYLYDISGKLCFSKTISFSKGNNTITLPQELNTGIYMLVCDDMNEKLLIN